jgi:hypothetical protein
VLKLVALHTLDCRSHDPCRENGRDAYGQDHHGSSVARGGPRGVQSIDQARADNAAAAGGGHPPVSPAANPTPISNPDRSCDYRGRNLAHANPQVLTISLAPSGWIVPAGPVVGESVNLARNSVRGTVPIPCRRRPRPS